MPLKGTLESAPKVAKSELLKNQCSDFRDRFVLKNSTVRCLIQTPEPRHHVGVIIDGLSILTGLTKLADKAVEIALAAIAQRHAHCNGLADYRFKPDRRLL